MTASDHAELWDGERSAGAPPDRECPRRDTCTLAETIDRLIEEFEALDDWDERYELIIEMGDDVPPLPEEYRTEANKVRGCLSTVWLVVEAKTTRPGEPPLIELHADSDSQIVRGLIAILREIYSGRTPEEILYCDIHCLFERLQLAKHLSGSRRNGLQAMIARIQDLARQHL